MRVRAGQLIPKRSPNARVGLSTAAKGPFGGGIIAPLEPFGQSESMNTETAFRAVASPRVCPQWHQIRAVGREAHRYRQTLALVVTKEANSRMVGNSEVILGADLFGVQVVNPILYCVGLSETDPQPRRCVTCGLVSGFVYWPGQQKGGRVARYS